MQLQVNGEIKSLDSVASLAGLLEKLDIDLASAGIAVAVNETVVPKSLWPERMLNDGDKIEIIQAVQGG